MNIKTTNQFDKDYEKLPDEIKKRLYKSLSLLMDNFQHPSLRVKKMRGKDNIWEARISDSYRITFQITNNTFIFRKIGQHDKALRNP
jgi:mRNA-degrading endonuclease RelE of RelBE toxin-antitoxin system